VYLHRTFRVRLNRKQEKQVFSRDHVINRRSRQHAKVENKSSRHRQNLANERQPPKNAPPHNLKVLSFAVQLLRCNRRGNRQSRRHMGIFKCLERPKHVCGFQHTRKQQNYPKLRLSQWPSSSIFRLSTSPCLQFHPVYAEGPIFPRFSKLTFQGRTPHVGKTSTTSTQRLVGNGPFQNHVVRDKSINLPHTGYLRIESSSDETTLPSLLGADQ